MRGGQIPPWRRERPHPTLGCMPHADARGMRRRRKPAGEHVAMATATPTDRLVELLGDDAESLLEHRCTTIPK
jgi:hypothetical protein